MAAAVAASLVTGIAAEAVRRRSRVPRDRVAHEAEHGRLTAEGEQRPPVAAADPAISPIPPELDLATPPDPPKPPGLPPASPVDALLFQPWRYPAGDWTDDPAVEDVWFASRDGVRLNGWFAEARRPRAVVLYLEGNAGNITGRRWVLRLFRERLGCSLLLFDYRGYGRSEGLPTIAGVLADAGAARRWLAGRVGIAEGEVVLVGNSLGGAVAVDLAARGGARGLVLENTFASLADVAERHFGRLTRLLVADRLDSASRIREYPGPLLQTHGGADRVVPYQSGRRLFEAAGGPKFFVGVPGGDHNDPPTREYLDALDRFLGALPAGGPKDNRTVKDRVSK